MLDARRVIVVGAGLSGLAAGRTSPALQASACVVVGYRPDAIRMVFAMWPTTLAGCVYFLVVFAAGFLMGTLRVLLIGPAVGETGAVLLEIPIMLAIAWFVSGRAIAWFAVPARLWPRLAMGGMAFALLMLAEIGVSVLAFQRTLVEHFQAYLAAPALIGLAGQIALALFPAAQLSGNCRKRAGRIPPSPG